MNKKKKPPHLLKHPLFLIPMLFEVFSLHFNKGRDVKKSTKKSLNLKSQISYYFLCQYNLFPFPRSPSPPKCQHTAVNKRKCAQEPGSSGAQTAPSTAIMQVDFRQTSLSCLHTFCLQMHQTLCFVKASNNCLQASPWKDRSWCLE